MKPTLVWISLHLLTSTSAWSAAPETTSLAKVVGFESRPEAGAERSSRSGQEETGPPPLPPPTADAESEAADDEELSLVERVYQRFYTLIWPAGRFEGNVSEAVANATERAEPEAGAVALYLVDVTTGEATRWPRPIGAREPAVCPGGTSFWYRRGDSLVRETVAPDHSGPAEAPMTLEEFSVRHLFACIHSGEGVQALVVDTADGEIAMIEWNAQGTLLKPTPTLPSESPRELAQLLGFFASLRPDGLQAFVRNGRLVGKRPGNQPLRLLTEVDLTFFGSPSWLGGSDVLVVSAVEAP